MSLFRKMTVPAASGDAGENKVKMKSAGLFHAGDNGPREDSGSHTLRQTSRTDKLTFAFYLGLAFFIPFILMLLAFAVAKISPFGQNQILVTDSWHQYYPFLVDYHDKLRTGGSLLWTWKSGGGTNYVALIAYYLASPLNFFSVLVPPERLREFFMFITCVKIGLSGMFFALFLRISFKRRDMCITAFGIMYALCAFIMGYYWNIIWLDTVALMPLVVAGTFALLRYGRYRLYIVSLALSILANYYIGLFVCIFVMLISIGYTIVEFKGLKKTVRDIFKMLGCSVVAAMTSAALTLPAYFALGHTQSTNDTFPANFSVNIGSTADLGGVLEGIGKTIANSVAFVQPTAKEGLPNVYSGVFTIFLAILFLFCSRIKKRERIVCAGLLIFFQLSFVIRQLDFIWHGFHFPNMLPYRFSFLYSFVLIYMAFRVYMYIDEVRPVSVIAALCGFAVYFGIAAAYYNGTDIKLSALFNPATGDGSAPDPVLMSVIFGLIMAAWVLIYSLRAHLSRVTMAILTTLVGGASVIVLLVKSDVFLAPLQSSDGASTYETFQVIIIVVSVLIAAASILALLSRQLNADHKMLRTLLGVVLLVLALIEGLLSSATGVKTVGLTDSSYYPLGTTNTLAMVDFAKDLEKDTIDLPRTEVNKYYTLNDNALIGADGISMFNSMVNSRITDYMEKFGLCGWIASNRYTYQESSPFTNMMLNLKYLIAPYGAYLDQTHNEKINSSDNVVLMRNRCYIPMGFMVNDDLLDYDISSLNANKPIGNQNEFFRLATGIDSDLYRYLAVTSCDAPDGGSVSESSFGSYSYSGDSDSGTYRINYTATSTGTAVAYFDTYYSDNVSLQVNDSEVISYYVKRPFIMMIGNVNAGDKITCSCSVSGSSTGTITSYVAMMDEDLFQQAYNLFSSSVLSATEVTDTAIKGTITAAEDGLFYTSISYVEGWKAYVDGQEAEITPVGGAMLAFRLSQGDHTIELRYIPEGFKAGVCISILGVLIFIAMLILTKKRINLLDLALARISRAKARDADAVGDDSAFDVPEAISDEIETPLDEPDLSDNASDTESDSSEVASDSLKDIPEPSDDVPDSSEDDPDPSFNADSPDDSPASSDETECE